jgi:glycosyltransferase involved in cell wall biosynthesis
MKILQINTTDTKGGAALIAWGLKKALTERGHTVSMIVGYKRSSDQNVREIFDTPVNRTVSKFFGRNIRNRIHHHLSYWLSNDIAFLPGKKISSLNEFRGADIVHAHNLHSLFFNLKALPKLSRQKPLVWTLHDMWPLTGGAAHAFDCPHWTTSGCSCKLPNTLPKMAWNNSRHLWKLKRHIYKNSRLTLVAPSQWLADQTKKSILSDKPLTVIYNGVDTDVFKPVISKPELREELSLPKDKKIVLFASKGGSKNPWKGWEYAEKIITHFSHHTDIIFICLGGYDNPLMPPNVITVPYIDSQTKLAKYYAASDLLLYPSVADNCPLTVLEAMACGLPVLTFATGGIPELVTHKKNGYVARYRHIDDLITGFDYLTNLSKQEETIFAETSRKRAVEQFSLEKMVGAYETLYKKLITAP